jgi:hypothetical protein
LEVEAIKLAKEEALRMLHDESNDLEGKLELRRKEINDEKEEWEKEEWEKRNNQNKLEA